MLYIIDGTGPWLDSTYDIEMNGSFCKQLNNMTGDRSIYNRGPSLLGTELSTIVDEIYLEIRRRPESEPVYLCGYSRGGAAAVIVARKINPRPVRAMFLFDAVDRAIISTGEKISGNVQNVYHAIRDREFARKYEDEVATTRKQLDKANAALSAKNTGNRIRSALLGGDPKATAQVRNRINAHAVPRNKDRDLKWKTRNATGLSPSNFGNTGLSVLPPGKYDTAKFAGSHGALGGLPWSDHELPGDSKAVPAVRAWMWARLIKEGVLTGKG
ncbi:MAG: thioesterase domain-containing protein [Pseudomonadaceae bacterium]|nr:thioesterase domain-containing protein [Pseudomonadaceae bacterium]